MRKLTEKQLNFCAEYVNNGGNGTAAYRYAYQQDNTDVCKTEACKLLKLKTIQNKIKEEEMDYRITGHGLGINKEVVLRTLKDAMEGTKVIFEKGVAIADVPDYTSRLKAIEVYAKLVGDFAPDKKMDVRDPDAPDTDITKMSKEEREEYKAKILAEL
jgi:phage terminase small subunit